MKTLNNIQKGNVFKTRTKLYL